jgi:hypothetical protein
MTPGDEKGAEPALPGELGRFKEWWDRVGWKDDCVSPMHIAMNAWKARAAIAPPRGLDSAREAPPAIGGAPTLTDERIVEIRDEHLPSQGDSFDCIAFARAILSAAPSPEPAEPEPVSPIPYFRGEQLVRLGNDTSSTTMYAKEWHEQTQTLFDLGVALEKIMRSDIDIHEAEAIARAALARLKGAEPVEPVSAERNSRAMFVARLENEAHNGRTVLPVVDVLALLSDCDYLASMEKGAEPVSDARLRDDALCFRFLQDLPVVAAQAYFWNYSSRRERRKVILAAARAALTAPTTAGGKA